MTAWVKAIQESDLEASEHIPEGHWIRYVSLEEAGNGMIFGMGRLESGEKVEHAHPEEEVFYVLRGRGVAVWEEGGTKHQANLAPGTAFYKTPNVHHAIRNTGDEPLLGLAFKV